MEIYATIWSSVNQYKKDFRERLEIECEMGFMRIHYRVCFRNGDLRTLPARSGNVGKLAENAARPGGASQLSITLMAKSFYEKSSVNEIRKRFDSDVERFSNLDTGQAATIDAPLAMELITEAAIAATPRIRRVLDIGCGAGNNAIRLAQSYGKGFACDLCDISGPMLERARQRLSKEKVTGIRVFEGDFRQISLEKESYDVILAAAVLHHLREESDWQATFRKVYELLRPGGSFWITDLVTQESASVHDLMWKRYGRYLETLGGCAYRDEVFAYIDKEDSPQSVTFQLDLLRKVGFEFVEVLHKNSCFAAFGAIKAVTA